MVEGTGSTGQATTGGDGASTGAPTSGGSTGGTTGGDERPAKPRGLESYLTGDPADADVTPTGPAVLVMGGSTDVDEAFVWQQQFVAGGDVVVLRTSGSDGYNDYLYTDIGGVDSVETLLVTTPELAADPYVAWTIRHAEAVFMAGGDQATYLGNWLDSPVEAAIMEVWARGGVVGGTSAGAAVLGEFVYAAYNDSAIEDEALLDPYNIYMTFERGFLALPPLAGVITDTHFTARRRLCRLIGFVARVVADGWGDLVVGIGVDEQTALVVDPRGVATVLGAGQVHLLHSNGAPQQCVAGETLEYAGLDWYVLGPGDSVALPAAVPEGVAAQALSAGMGALDPPYDCVE
jgi:cyanophycinase